MNKGSRLDNSRPCLVVAPHLEYPARNGGDILIDRRWAEFSRFVPYVDIVGKETVTRYSGGVLESRSAFRNGWRSKRNAAFRTLVKGSHYLLEKYLTPEFRDAALRYLEKPEYGTVVFSLISTASLYSAVPFFPGRLYCVETQNDEVKWYRDIGRASSNPVARLVAFSSGRWLRLFLKRHWQNFVFIHVSNADRDGYLELMPIHENIVSPVGVDIEPSVPDQDLNGMARLIFAGSLGVKMNMDALKLFAARFYPVLKKGLGTGLEIVVAGSKPSPEARALCAANGWTLHPDVSDEELRGLYASSIYAILPFEYVNGGKLKLLKSLSYGLPILSTNGMRGQLDAELEGCVFTDDPEEWLSAIRKVSGKGLGRDERAALAAYAARFSWPLITAGMAGRLGGLPDTRAAKMLAPTADCLVCGGRLLPVAEDIFDTRFGVPGLYAIARCGSCGLEQTIPAPDPADLKRLYEKYYNFSGVKAAFYSGFRERFLSSPFYRIWLALDGDISFHGLRGTGRLLDIGCNEGRGLAIFRSHGYSPEGLELNTKAAEIARSKGFKVYTSTLDRLHPEKNYDIAVLSNVLEHSTDPRGMLRDVKRVLKPGGRVWISCPNSQSWLRTLFGKYWINWHVPFHIVHFNPASMASLLRECGFREIVTRQRTPALWVAQSLLSRLFAKSGTPAKCFRSTALVAALTLSARAALFPLLWLGNRANKGDCMVITAERP